MVRNGMTVKQNFHQIWIVREKGYSDMNPMTESAIIWNDSDSMLTYCQLGP